MPTGANSNASVTASILFKCFYTNSTTEDGLLQTLPGLTSWRALPIQKLLSSKTTRSLYLSCFVLKSLWSFSLQPNLSHVVNSSKMACIIQHSHIDWPCTTSTQMSAWGCTWYSSAQNMSYHRPTGLNGHRYKEHQWMWLHLHIPWKDSPVVKYMIKIPNENVADVAVWRTKHGNLNLPGLIIWWNSLIPSPGSPDTQCPVIIVFTGFLNPNAERLSPSNTFLAAPSLQHLLYKSTNTV